VHLHRSLTQRAAMLDRRALEQRAVDVEQQE
jgi:hypothetical protein